MLRELQSIARALRGHLLGVASTEERAQLDALLAIVTCNRGSVLLHQDKLVAARRYANEALRWDTRCTQALRIEAEFLLEHAKDDNLAADVLAAILEQDATHPFAVNTRQRMLAKRPTVANPTATSSSAATPWNCGQSCPRLPSMTPGVPPIASRVASVATQSR